MANGKPFFGGIPTVIDVTKLMSVYPKLSVGMTITHDELEKVLNLNRKAARYRTVVNAWRYKIFKEQNEFLGSICGVGYKVLSPEERRDATIEMGGGIARKARKMVRHAVTIDTSAMKDVDRRSVETLRLFSMRLAAEATSANKAIQFEIKALGHSTYDERRKAAGGG